MGPGRGPGPRQGRRGRDKPAASGESEPAPGPEGRRRGRRRSVSGDSDRALSQQTPDEHSAVQWTASGLNWDLALCSSGVEVRR
jgi:hypothetical protein